MILASILFPASTLFHTQLITLLLLYYSKPSVPRLFSHIELTSCNSTSTSKLFGSTRILPSFHSSIFCSPVLLISYPPINPFTFPFFHPSIFPSFHPLLVLPSYLFIHPSSHPSTLVPLFRRARVGGEVGDVPGQVNQLHATRGGSHVREAEVQRRKQRIGWSFVLVVVFCCSCFFLEVYCWFLFFLLFFSFLDVIIFLCK